MLTGWLLANEDRSNMFTNIGLTKIKSVVLSPEEIVTMFYRSRCVFDISGDKIRYPQGQQTAIITDNGRREY